MAWHLMDSRPLCFSSFRSKPDNRAEALPYGLHGLRCHYSEGFDDTAFGKGKDFIKSDPTGFGESPLNQVSRPDLERSILLFNGGDGQPDEIGMSVRRSQHQYRPRLR